MALRALSRWPRRCRTPRGLQDGADVWVARFEAQPSSQAPQQPASLQKRQNVGYRASQGALPGATVPNLGSVTCLAAPRTDWSSAAEAWAMETERLKAPKKGGAGLIRARKHRAGLHPKSGDCYPTAGAGGRNPNHRLTRRADQKNGLSRRHCNHHLLTQQGRL